MYTCVVLASAYALKCGRATSAGSYPTPINLAVIRIFSFSIPITHTPNSKVRLNFFLFWLKTFVKFSFRVSALLLTVETAVVVVVVNILPVTALRMFRIQYTPTSALHMRYFACVYSKLHTHAPTFTLSHKRLTAGSTQRCCSTQLCSENGV